MTTIPKGTTVYWNSVVLGHLAKDVTLTPLTPRERRERERAEAVAGLVEIAAALLEDA